MPGVTAEFLKGLEVIERNSRLQTHLISDLLDYAGMRFGKMNLDIVATYPAIALQSPMPSWHRWRVRRRSLSTGMWPILMRA